MYHVEIESKGPPLKILLLSTSLQKNYPKIQGGYLQGKYLLYSGKPIDIIT